MVDGLQLNDYTGSMFWVFLIKEKVAVIRDYQIFKCKPALIWALGKSGLACKEKALAVKTLVFLDA